MTHSWQTKSYESYRKRREKLEKRFSSDVFETAVIFHSELVKWKDLWIDSSSNRVDAILDKEIEAHFLLDHLASPIDNGTLIKVAYRLWKIGKDISPLLVQRKGHEKLDKTIILQAHGKLMKYYPLDGMVKEFEKMK